MFKTRTFVALGLLVAAVIAVIVVRGKKDEHVAELGQSTGAPPPVVAAEVDGLEIVEPGKPKIVLKKDGATWKLVEPVADRADDKAVERVTSALAELRFVDVVADSKSAQEALEIRDEDAISVTAKKGETVVLAFLIGKKNHVRLPGKDAIWQIGGLSRAVLSKDAKLWRFREVLRFDADEVERLEAVVDGQKIVAARTPAKPGAEGQAGTPATWSLVEGQALVGGPLDEEVPTAMLGSLARLDVAEFADGVDADKAGLAAPRALLTVVKKGDARHVVELGAVDGELQFARADGKIFKLRKATGDALGKPPLQWRDKTLAKLDVASVKKIELDKAGEKLVFARAAADGAWTLAAGKVDDFDGSRVSGLAGAFASLRAQAIAAPGIKLGKPSGRLRALGDGGAVLADLTFGETTPEGTTVQVTGKKDLFLLSEGSVKRLLKSAADFKKVAAPAGMPPGMQMH